MKALLIIIMFSLPSIAVSKGITLSLSAVTLNDAIIIFYSEVIRKPYMISPDIANDKRLVSFSVTPEIDAYDFMLRYLKNAGLTVS
ncbi:type II secretion system protein GspD, partial [Yersinia enterocolitica]|nr:type II secretion system protein GspD [Yersinia enterocolitica]